jgi:hypothetical protein
MPSGTTPNYLHDAVTASTVSTAASTASTAYPYFTSPGVDLYSGSYSAATGVYSSKTLQATRPRNKARSNAGKEAFKSAVVVVLLL